MNPTYMWNSFQILYVLSLSCILKQVYASEALVPFIETKETLDAVKKNPTGTVVHYARNDIQKPDRQIDRFIGNFKKAANSLKDYGVKFYTVDCSDKGNGIKKECSQPRDYVFVYSIHQGGELDLSLLFDEDHIVGHVLMFILSYDVQVVQDKYMWDEIMSNSKGSKDVILGYFRGIGDKDHRFFMETAFVYGKEYKFVLTTTMSMPGLQGEGSLWYYHCKDASPDTECKYKIRKMPPKNVLDVIRFIKLDGISRIVEIKEDGSSNFDRLDLTFPLNKVFLVSSNVNKMRELAMDALKSVDDSFVFILVNAKTRIDVLPEFGLDLGVDWDDIPGTLVLQPAHLIGSDQKYYEHWPMHLDFTLKNLIDVLNQYHKSPNKAYKELVKQIDIQMLQLEDWRKPKNGTIVVGGCMQELPECIGYSIVFRRIARSISLSNIEQSVAFAFVDFTERPQDAKLNTIPGFMIYKEGKEIKHKGQMDYESILEFVWKNLSALVRRLPLSGSDHIPLLLTDTANEDGEEEDDDDSANLLQMEDDPMGKLAVDIVKRTVKDEGVISLTDKTFNSTKKSNELMVTLFFLPWCVKSIILREQYAKVVKEIEANKSTVDISTTVNKVNCFNWEDVCRKENVTSYPTIQIYRKGRKPVVYADSLDVETLKGTIKIYQTPVVQELTDSNSLRDYMNLDLPSTIPVSILGLFTSKKDKELKIFKKTAEELFGKYPFAYAAGSIAKESARENELTLPSLVMLKRNDPFESMSIVEGFRKLSEFIEEHSMPSYGELLAVNLPKYLKYGKPILIQFKERNDTINEQAILNLVMKTQKIFVTWMDMSKRVTKEIMRAYKTDGATPALVMVNHKQGKVYKFEGPVSNSTLVSWVKSYLKGKLKPVAELADKKWKPLRKPFDYLKMENEINDKIAKADDAPSVELGADDSESGGDLGGDTAEEVDVTDEAKEDSHDKLEDSQDGNVMDAPHDEL